MDRDYSDWVGRTEIAHDIANPAAVAGLAVTLDHDGPPWRAGEVPPLGHWLYFLPRARQSAISVDGHPHRGGFLPPVDLPRRMWAGGSFQFLAPIAFGARLTRLSSIQSIVEKQGRSGPMVFVTVRHDISADGIPALVEFHDIVYRQAPQPGAALSVLPTSNRPAEWRRCVDPDIVLLFRFSALTFNGHRIHYDRDYCRDVEGYPGLVVHGPLTATLLMDLYLRQFGQVNVKSFAFKASAPLFDIHPFTICGISTKGGAELWAETHDGHVAMTAWLEAE